jgi:hypothetical protein
MIQSGPPHAPVQPPGGSPVPSARKPRKSRIWRLLVLALFLLVAAVMLSPFILGTGFVRARVETTLSRQLSTRVKIGRLRCSWFSGVSLEGLEIGNVRGFDQSHPFLSLQRLDADMSLFALLRGRFDCRGEVAGLHVYLDEDSGGRTNVAELFGLQVDHRVVDVPVSRLAPEKPANGDFALDDLRLDLRARDCAIEIRRAGQVLESLHDLGCTIDKDYGKVVKLDFATKLGATADKTHAGSLLLRGDYDIGTSVANGTLAASGLDFARYKPLADVFLGKDALTALGGVLNGNLTLRYDGTPDAVHLAIGGEMAVQEPRFAGALLQGMDVHASRWTATPALTIAFGRAGLPPQVDAEKFFLDLGCLQVRGLDAKAIGEVLGGRPGIGLDCTVDLDALAAFGGPLPELLRNTSGKVGGKVGLPLQGGRFPDWRTLLRQFVADAQISARTVRYDGFDLTNLAGKLTVKDGAVQLVTSSPTVLNAGALALTLTSSLQDPDSMPLQIGIDWQGGRLGGETAELLRYAVPLLAGTKFDSGSFASVIDLGLHLQGPALPHAGESWLQYANRWSGDGHLALHDGSLVPAAALQGLLGFLGQQGRLAIDKLDGGFTLRQGFVESQLLRWTSKGNEYHLVGKTGLDGALDFKLDATSLLEQHKDGRKIAAFLGNGRLLAGLAGSLTAPRLALPDLGKLLQDSLRAEAQAALKKQADDVLQQALHGLFGRKKQ